MERQLAPIRFTAAAAPSFHISFNFHNHFPHFLLPAMQLTQVILLIVSYEVEQLKIKKIFRSVGFSSLIYLQFSLFLDSLEGQMMARTSENCFTLRQILEGADCNRFFVLDCHFFSYQYVFFFSQCLS